MYSIGKRNLKPFSQILYKFVCYRRENVAILEIERNFYKFFLRSYSINKIKTFLEDSCFDARQKEKRKNNFFNHIMNALPITYFFSKEK